MNRKNGNLLLGFAVAAIIAGSALGQVAPVSSSASADDTPRIAVSGLLFADYTYQDAPKGTDADGNTIHQNSFNIGRAYINVFGTLSHLVSARITTDIVRESDGSGTTTSINGSYVYRLKFAYGEVNLDEWMGKGTWLRLGLNQTPYINGVESVYRYRFQGAIFVDREGFLTSSDLGFSGHYNFPANYGDIHLGVYNGEGYSKSEANDQKAFQIRASLRPAPAVPVLKGLRLTGFYDADHYQQSDKKTRFVGAMTFEHPYVNFGAEWLDARDKATAAGSEVHAEGYSIWATPRTPIGIEALLRYDNLNPNKDGNARKKRTIAGIAYWFPVQKGVSAALLADYETVKYSNYVPASNTEKRWALHTLLSF
jgi:hypothetical protein